MADPVVDQVGHQLFEQHRVPEHRGGGGGHREPHPGEFGRALDPAGHPGQHLAEIHGTRVLHRPVAAGEHQQPLDQPFLAGVHLQELSTQVAHPLVGVRVAHGVLDQGTVDRQRGPQLVGGVRDEPALTVEGAVEPLQHVVEGVGQFPDLVAGPGQRHALVQAPLGHASRVRGDLAERSQGTSGHQPADRHREDTGDGQRDEGLVEQVREGGLPRPLGGLRDLRGQPVVHGFDGDASRLAAHHPVHLGRPPVLVDDLAERGVRQVRAQAAFGQGVVDRHQRRAADEEDEPVPGGQPGADADVRQETRPGPHRIR